MNEKSIKNKIEKIQENIIVQYPSSYIWAWKAGSVICLLCLIVTIILGPNNEKNSIISVILTIFIISILCGIIYRRYHIFFNEYELKIVPMLGKTKLISYKQITEIKLGKNKELIFFLQTKPVLKIYPAMQGYDEILSVLRQNI